MNEEQIKRQFSVRIRENYDCYLKGWLSSEPEELVSYAEEISATKMLAEELPKVASAMEMEYLLHLDNPLEVVRDGWMSYCNIDNTKALRHIIWFTEHNVSLWGNYAVSKEHTTTQNPAPLTVREFLERYPGEAFDMITSSGYVSLTPGAAQKALAGGLIAASPGCQGSDMDISYDELLEQTVANASYSDGKWNICSVGSDEPEQAQGKMEVTMC